MLRRPSNPISLALAAFMVFVLAFPGASLGAMPGEISGAATAAAGDGPCPACDEVPVAALDATCVQFCLGTCVLAHGIAAPSPGSSVLAPPPPDRLMCGLASAPEPNPPKFDS